MFAYLDANSGSLVASAVAAGFGGVAVAANFAWRRLKRKVGVSPSNAEEPSPDSTGGKGPAA